jgi:hypothetical protein
MQYRPHQAGEARKLNGRASDLGAFEFGSTSVARTSSPVPKENKGGREGQPPTTDVSGQDDSRRQQAAAQADKKAGAYLNYAKSLLERGMIAKAKERLEEVAETFPGTASALEASRLLKQLGDR